MNKTKARQIMGAIGAPVFLGAFLTYGAPLFLASTVGAVYMMFHVEINEKIKDKLKEDKG